MVELVDVDVLVELLELVDVLVELELDVLVLVDVVVAKAESSLFQVAVVPEVAV